MESCGLFVRISIMHKRIILVLIALFTVQFIYANEGDFGGSLDFLLPGKKIAVSDIERLFPSTLFEPLCRLNEDGTPYSNVFKSIEFNSEELSLLLEFNDDLKWHDGSSIKADEIYGAMKGFAAKMQGSGYIASDGEVVLFQTSVIKIRLQANPDPVFYYFMSKSFFKDDSGKNRWAGPFVPQALGDGRLIMHANQYSLSGRPYLNEIIFRPANYDRFAASLLSLGCGGADFDMSLPDYCMTDEESFSIKPESTLFLIALGEGIPLYHRQKIAALLRSADFIKGIAKGNASKTDQFPLSMNASENIAGAEDIPIGQDEAVTDTSVPKNIRCPEIGIKYISYSVFPLLAERVRAILQSAGYKASKDSLELDENFNITGNGILITAIGLNADSNAPWYNHMLELLDILGLNGGWVDGLIVSGEPNIGMFRTMEKRLMESGKLFYLFTAERYRVFTCGVGGEGGFEDYYLDKSRNEPK